MYASIFETVELTNYINKKWAKKLVNAILRQIQRDKNTLQQQSHHSHPLWLVKKLKQQAPNDYQNILNENNQQAPMSIRVNIKKNIDEYTKQLKIKTINLKIAPQSLILEKPLNIKQLPDFENGSCFIQDISPQLAAIILQPKNEDIILDACAAPGGKTIHLSELAPKSTIIALDSSSERQKRIIENINRYQVDNIKIINGQAQKQDWWDGKLFDKILLDAPCSATGVIRRHPDIKLLRQESDIAKLVKLQQQILTNLWKLLKPNGILLYATCSILKEENSQQITNFLNKNNDAIEEPINLNWGHSQIGKQNYPNKYMDGFYYAKLRKK
ncbi:Ribosomal RNA small subunit methyltransferase B [hydrothermal vent metagenome]|uniref:Ribosomal RNA small subunit methyltransferase B n=1 Tax=hydrothermal vent metagenome TaxID=652676 RepID=A0A1W1CEG2_9ZZZZ